MAGRRKLYEYSAENDIRYRGPFSYLTFQIFGWLCIVVSVFALLVQLSVRIVPVQVESRLRLISQLQNVASLSLPFLLIANFAKILNNTDRYQKQLMRNGLAALGICAASALFVSRYIISLAGKFVTDPEAVLPLLEDFFFLMQKQGFFAFNIFIDLFLCTLFMYFLIAFPKRVFTGKKRIIFRSFALLPIAYEVLAIFMKGQVASGLAVMPLWTFPLLPVKPPMAFVVFVVLVLFIKRRELHFRRNGKTHREFLAFLKTNRNSLHFSISLCISLVAAALLDYLILRIFLAVSPSSAEVVTIGGSVRTRAYMVITAMGFGKAFVPLMLVSPFVLLFSYTRIPKNRHLSMYIPLAALALVFILLLEAGYNVLSTLSKQVTPVSVKELLDKLLHFP